MCACAGSLFPLLVSSYATVFFRHCQPLCGKQNWLCTLPLAHDCQWLVGGCTVWCNRSCWECHQQQVQVQPMQMDLWMHICNAVLIRAPSGHLFISNGNSQPYWVLLVAHSMPSAGVMIVWERALVSGRAPDLHAEALWHPRHQHAFVWLCGIITCVMC